MGKEWFVDICMAFYDVFEVNIPNGGIRRIHVKDESRTKILLDVFTPTVEFVTKYCDSSGNVNKEGLLHLGNNADINIFRLWEDLTSEKYKDIFSYRIEVESAKLVQRETSVKEKFLDTFKNKTLTVLSDNCVKVNKNHFTKQCKYGKWCVKNKKGTCTFKH